MADDETGDIGDIGKQSPFLLEALTKTLRRKGGAEARHNAPRDLESAFRTEREREVARLSAEHLSEHV